MKRLLSIVALIPCLLANANRCAAGELQDVVAKGKATTAFIEVETPQGSSSGSGFCIDKSGLFVTNAHVVEGLQIASEGRVRVVINIGSKDQQVLKAKLVRADDDVDLALLKVPTIAGLVPLELGKDAELTLTAEVTTFGFPFGKLVAVARDAFPDISVNRSRITSLKKDKGRLKVVQFDGQINPGNSGGPVLDADGRLVGVAWATVRGAGVNFAIPVGLLADFLAAPGLVFEPPPLPYEDRSKQVSWTIKVQPPMPDVKLPTDLGVTISILSGDGEEPRVVTAKSSGNGEFRATLTPVPRDPGRKVAVDAIFDGRIVHLEIKDGEIKVAGRKFLASDLRQLIGGPSPRAITARGESIFGPILGLPKIKTKINDKPVTIDLDQAASITLRPLGAPDPVRWVEARVEAKQAGKVLAAVVKRVEFPGAPAAAPATVVLREPRTNRRVVVTPGADAGAVDAGRLKIEGSLDASENPLSAGVSIRPPSIPIGDVTTGESAAGQEPLRRLSGHSNGIWGVAISPDGRQVLSGSHDVTVRLWDVATGREIRRFPGHSDHVKGVAFLPDGIRGLSVADDDTLRLWDLRTGIELRSFRGHTADLSSLAVSSDGTRILTGACDKTARLWDLATGRELRKFVGHTDVLQGVAFLPDGQRIVTAAADGTARLWEVATGRELARFDPKAGSIFRVAVSPDGHLALVACNDGTIRAWDFGLDKEVGRLVKHDDMVNTVVFTPDGRRAISAGGGKDHTIRFWDLATFQELRGLRRSESGSPSLVVSADGRLVVAAFGGQVALWGLPAIDAPASAVAKLGPLERVLPGKVSDVAIGGGGRYLLLTMKDVRKLAVFDVNAADIVKTIPLASQEVLVAAGAAKFVIAFPEEKLIQRWDLGTMTRDYGPAATLSIDGRLKRISLGSDSHGPILAAWLPESGQGAASVRFSFLALDSLKVVRVGSISTGGFQGIANVSASGGSFTLHPFLNEGTLIRASAGGGLFTFWNTTSSPSGFQTLQLKGDALAATYNHDDLSYLVPGPDGRTIYTGRGGRREADGKVIGKNDGPQGQATESCLPSPDPAYFLTISPPNQVRSPNPQAASPNSVSFRSSGDGSILFTSRGIDEIFSGGMNLRQDKSDLTIEKRVHFIPSAKLLVTIAATDDRLVLRRLDIEEAIEQLAGDYLFVTSPGTVSATAGQTLEHQIVARSKKGKVQFALADGPDGLRVLPDGRVIYPVPKSSKDGEATAVITVSDESGQEQFHKLTIRYH